MAGSAHPRNRIAASRRGFTFVEILTAVTMLIVLLGLMGQIMAQSKRQAAASETKARSMILIENTMELAAALPWDQIDDELLAEFPLDDELKRHAPAGELVCKVVETHDPVPNKRITLTLTPETEGARPTRLTSWVYRQPTREEP
jgi:hypothetical protein